MNLIKLRFEQITKHILIGRINCRSIIKRTTEKQDPHDNHLYDYPYGRINLSIK